ncbi:MAG TPA: imidazole glycerol phosphate synthase subunit HisH [Gammaproteobacteria bacterium]|nr:imidazole glycerol phosphate synthase subunit HisH [Gammaproteobacteria bacterium]
MKVGVINLNSGNLLSVVSALKRIGHEVQVIDKPAVDFDALVMPGQGRFAFVANQLNQNNWRSFITEWIHKDKKFIGICVGMQLLFESSEEDKGAVGLAVLKGKITKLQHPKTPMVGWAKLSGNDDFLNQQYVYFVNSYAVSDSEYCIAKVDYGNSFCAAVQKNNLYAFQFHPEKSGDYGLELLQHCLGE